jgi:hypothetical protein
MCIDSSLQKCAQPSEPSSFRQQNEIIYIFPSTSQTIFSLLSPCVLAILLFRFSNLKPTNHHQHASTRPNCPMAKSLSSLLAGQSVFFVPHSLGAAGGLRNALAWCDAGRPDVVEQRHIFDRFRNEEQKQKLVEVLQEFPRKSGKTLHKAVGQGYADAVGILLDLEAKPVCNVGGERLSGIEEGEEDSTDMMLSEN